MFKRFSRRFRWNLVESSMQICQIPLTLQVDLLSWNVTSTLIGWLIDIFVMESRLDVHVCSGI